MLRTARDAAILDGCVEAGRRLNGWAREVVPVRTAYVADLTEEQKQHLSTTADATTAAAFTRSTHARRQPDPAVEPVGTAASTLFPAPRPATVHQ